MGCCQNKELYIVCSWDWDEGDHLAKGIWRQKHVDQFEVEEKLYKGEAEASSKRLVLEEESDLPQLRTPLHLTGTFAEWRTDFAPSRLRRVALEQDTLRLAMCLRLTSQSFSFQVVSPSKGWTWRLYPRDAQPIRFTHVSKEGKLVAGEANAVAVAVGDMRAGHGLNFHVVEQTGAVVTVWVEVPVSQEQDFLTVRFDSNRAVRVWYTLEDQGVQYEGGDGVDLEKYRWMGWSA
ncbi:unnamed protein product [Durusdinium trenchii]|uniref:Uncharacterized protein n=2 Tax=Durusdinium trenchii TaxID=1381693 RepID=A0ABP0RXF6_9DINO